MTLDVQALRLQLLADRERVVDALALLHTEHQASEGSESSDNHVADPSVVAVEREIDSTLGGSAESVLAAIDAALARIDAGTFGTCTSCGQPIGDERLTARPHTELCIDCKRRAERR